VHDSYEAVTSGETVELGGCAVTRAEIVSFGERYDPQAFHVSDDHDGPFEGVIASGWQTAALTMRLVVDGYLGEAETVGSPGLDGLRWREPVRPGDRLSATLTLGEKEPFDDERGLVHQEIETRNQRDETVLWMDALTLYPRRSRDTG
jgi:acyl dehydratase